MPETRAINPNLAEVLRFKPWPPFDPVPWWILEHLDRKQVARVALIGLEMQNEVLEAALKANTQAAEVLKGIAK